MHVSAKYNVPPSALCASASGPFFPELHNLIRFERKDGACSGSDEDLSFASWQCQRCYLFPHLLTTVTRKRGLDPKHLLLYSTINLDRQEGYGYKANARN